jgi:hypothetical protein
MAVMPLLLLVIERFNFMVDLVLLMSVMRSFFYAELYGVNISMAMRHIIIRI